ncbi:hypothetical protein Nmel_010703, partial [Mimus melanotis]
MISQLQRRKREGAPTAQDFSSFLFLASIHIPGQPVFGMPGCAEDWPHVTNISETFCSRTVLPASHLINTTAQ